MHRTRFAGLTAPDPGDPPTVDNGTFFTRNPDLIDRFLSIGAITHRHDAHPALGNPILAPSAQVIPSGGAIGPDVTLYAGYTLSDDDGGETVLSEAAAATTNGPLPEAQTLLGASADYTGGFLVTGQYSYGQTLQDESGGETGLGPVITVSRDPGFASGQIHLSGLSAALDPPDGGIEWRLWRSINGGPWRFLAEGTGDTYTDDGTVIPDADNTQQPPLDSQNSTRGNNAFLVTLPTVLQEPTIGSATAINLYITEGGFTDPCYYSSYPIASAGSGILIPVFNVAPGSPPEISTAIRGANRINAETDIYNLHWLPPVASASLLPSGVAGDARIAISDGFLCVVLGSAAHAPGDWTKLPLNDVDVTGTIHDVVDIFGTDVANPGVLEFVGAGGISASVAASGTSAVVTITPGPDADASGTVADVLDAFGIDVHNPESLTILGASGASAHVVASGGSAIFTITAGVGSVYDVLDGLGGEAMRPDAIKFLGASGASAHVVASAGSAIVTYYAGIGSVFDVVDAFGGDVMRPDALKFVGAGGVSATVAASGTSAVVTITQAAGGGGGSSLHIEEYTSPTFTDITHGKLAFRTASLDVQVDVGNDRVVIGGLAPHFNSQGDAPYGGSLASGASANFTWDVDSGGDYERGVHIYRVTASRACRIRLYAASAYRTADLARPIGTDPTGDHGCLLEVVLPAGLLDLMLSPQVMAMSKANDTAFYANVMNMGATGTTDPAFWAVTHR
jgi:hypothetical protein